MAGSISITSSHNARKRARAVYTTEDPWRSLISSLTKLVSSCGFDARIFELPRILYVDVLTLAAVQIGPRRKQCHFPGGFALHEPNAQEYFASSQHQELLDQACSLSVIEGFDNYTSTAIAQEYVDCLARHGVDGLKKQLIVDRGILNSKYMECKSLPPEADMRDSFVRIPHETVCTVLLLVSKNVEEHTKKEILTDSANSLGASSCYGRRLTRNPPQRMTVCTFGPPCST